MKGIGVGAETGCAPRVLVVYSGRYAPIRALAAHVREGIGIVPGTEVDLLELDDAPCHELRAGATTTDDALHARWAALFKRVVRADAFVIVAPSSIPASAVAGARFFNDLAVAAGDASDGGRPWYQSLFRDKPGAVLVSEMPRGGDGQTRQALLTLMAELGMVVITPGKRGTIRALATDLNRGTIAAPQAHCQLSADEAGEARDLGRRVAEVGAWLRAGRRLESGRLHEAVIARARRCSVPA
jgi:multimeric flavodoxin WrbA